MDLKHEASRLMPKITRLTASKINDSQDQLNKISWHKGESNTDLEFSELAKEKCIESFNEINTNKDLGLEVEVPDLLLIFKKGNIRENFKIELKSTKSNDGSVPGSMIMTLDPNMWTIFCLRRNDEFHIRYGRYYLGMSRGSHDLFQDRSPRPRLRFENYQNIEEEPNLRETTIDKSFYKHYANSAVNRVLNPKGRGSWQDDLVKEIIRIVIADQEKFKDI
tara:strand:- start:1292 stop:1954 length:663 start_codon:yes stop_codon:yes gene_type:complete